MLDVHVQNIYVIDADERQKVLQRKGDQHIIPSFFDFGPPPRSPLLLSREIRERPFHTTQYCTTFEETCMMCYSGTTMCSSLPKTYNKIY